MENTQTLAPGTIVLIEAFDDIPAHLFEIEDVFEGCVTGLALTGPLAGEYGEPDIEMILRVVSPEEASEMSLFPESP